MKQTRKASRRIEVIASYEVASPIAQDQAVAVLAKMFQVFVDGQDSSKNLVISPRRNAYGSQSASK